MTQAEYEYNADGLRVSKTVNGAATNHIWDGANIAADVTNGTVTKYIRGIQLISSKQGNNEIFYNYNGHGDVVQLTSSTGSITKQYTYDAFGIEKNKDEADTNPFRYCGEYFDEETGYTYLRNRYYDSDKGRFINEDPARSGLNWYNYCDNNPIMFVDPLGLNSVMVEAIMKKNGGTVNWNGETQTLTVGMPNSDKTLSFKIGETQNINGNMIVDHQLLMDTFGFTYEQVNHADGDFYDRPEDAALAFGLVYNWFSTDRSVEGYSNGREYVASIVNENGKYKYVNVQEGEGDKAKLSVVNGMVAWVHTHGAYRSPNDWESDVFSGFDIKMGGGDGYASYKYSCTGFLITPGGALVSITPDWFIQKLNDIGGNLDDPRIKVADNNDPGVSILGYGIPHQPKGW